MPGTGNIGVKTPVQKVAAVVGAVFLLVGLLGFIPGITTDYEQISFAGHHSDALLLGLFQVSILHNAVHLLFGIAGLLMARSATGARAFLIGDGTADRARGAPAPHGRGLPADLPEALGRDA